MMAGISKNGILSGALGNLGFREQQIPKLRTHQTFIVMGTLIFKTAAPQRTAAFK
ncbi:MULTISPECIES: hypothetical protein [Chryseobacterium]|uniref:Uncharacterized protein n=1 Tax=Chryseobacterium salivictor TaxID=2547600 RepID=A0A4P6ZC60_9FLAO|nr:MULTISPECIES: hypothetical protein [Chryseobacterium]MDQ0477615.1 hypothetical protein [Chryseobacterium sp. MDT2-18]QBO57058.1 hypothetical protein NBC122_00200 [Chryseobacterium salivictor]